MPNPVVMIPGLLASYASNVDASEHSHSALQIVWPEVNYNCHISSLSTQSPVLIGSGVSHKVTLERGWIVLIEPYSILGKELEKRLNGKDILEFNDIKGCPKPIKVNLIHSLRPLWEQLGIDTRKQFEPEIGDKRIAGLIYRINFETSNESLKSDNWKAINVAASLSLSEGRFLHLFREQMGMTWRPYLRWCRVMRAVHMIQAGFNATEAAMDSGFTDSAHFSRTFRSTFGMTLRQVKNLIVQD